MKYPKDIENRLGFDRIREELARRCVTDGAKELVAEIDFLTDFDRIKRLLDQTDQMKSILMMENNFPSSGYVDIKHLVSKIRVLGTFLEPEEMLNISKALEIMGDISSFFKSKDESMYPALRDIISDMQTFPHIISRINAIVDRFAKIKDSASPEIAAIRRELNDKNREVSKRLQSILRKAQSDGLVEEDISVSIRDGRAVIPVPAANKRKINGFIHDESATGKTAYIEPIEVVELNNTIKELEYRERREIVKILTEFADFIRPDSEGLFRTSEILYLFDFIKAKALSAIDMEAVKIILSDEMGIEYRKARHPLLEKTLKKENKPIVPLDINITKQKHILVISGPNAGGKSVCLKCVGLLQYMLQCGLLIPAKENSSAGIFSDIFIDIGDQQSLDNDLSTYSSHLQNMKMILRSSSSSSLVLIDEFGTGTEPALGGAIAETILQKLEERGVFAVITTHYSNIKYYASNAKGVINGAMSFDVQKISPLFSLEIGKPGSSFAFEIARKIGLPEDIVKEAQQKIGSGQVNIEKQLREIARDKRYWENKRNKIRLADKRAEELAEQYSTELSKVKEDRNRIIKEAKEKATTIVSEVNKRIENTIREIKESQAEKERTKNARADFDTFKNEIMANESDEQDLKIEQKMKRLLDKQQNKKPQKTEQPENKKPEAKTKAVEVGCKVIIKGQTTAGEVLKIEKGKATVAFGSISTAIETERLEVVSNTIYNKQNKEPKRFLNFAINTDNTSNNYDVSEKRLNFRSNIDVRGMRAMEAIDKTKELVDEAIMLGIKELKILHGKGTGALKEEIRKYLKTIDLVKSAKDEHEEFGGSGITIVILDL